MLNAITLKTAATRWCAAMHQAAPELNELDGRLGDADLGATLDKCATLMEKELTSLPSDLTGIFRALAQASARASGSSFGTLLTLALMTAAKHSSGKDEMNRKEVADLIAAVLTALSSRGGASLGDKTVLDSLEAIRRALAAMGEDKDVLPVALQAAQGALDEFREKPNRVGRARMFAQRTIGMDDPGMVAVLRMLEGLQAKSS